MAAKTNINLKTNTAKNTKKKTISHDRASFKDEKPIKTIAKPKTSTSSKLKETSETSISSNRDFYRSTLRFKNSKQNINQDYYHDIAKEVEISKTSININDLYNKNKNNQSSLAYIYKTYLEDIFNEESTLNEFTNEDDKLSIIDDDIIDKNNLNRLTDESIYDSEPKFYQSSKSNILNNTQTNKQNVESKDKELYKVIEDKQKKSIIKDFFNSLFKSKNDKQLVLEKQNNLEISKFEPVLKDTNDRAKVNEVTKTTIDQKPIIEEVPITNKINLESNVIFDDSLVNIEEQIDLEDGFEKDLIINDLSFINDIKLAAPEVKENSIEEIIIDADNEEIYPKVESLKPIPDQEVIVENQTFINEIILENSEPIINSVSKTSKSNKPIEDNKEIIDKELNPIKILNVDIDLRNKIEQPEDYYFEIENNYLNDLNLTIENSAEEKQISDLKQPLSKKIKLLDIFKEYYKTVLFGILFGILIFDVAVKFIPKESVKYNFSDINSSYTTKDYSIEVPSDWSFSDEYPGFLVNKDKKLEFKMSISAGDITIESFNILLNELKDTHEIRKDLVNDIEVYGFEYKDEDIENYNYYLLYYDGAAIVINLQNENYSYGLDIISTIK